MKKSNLMWMGIATIAATTMLSGCSWFCPKCPDPTITKTVCTLPSTFKSLTSVEATTMTSAYNASTDNSTTGVLLEGGLVEYLSCSGYANVYAEFGMTGSTVEVVYVGVKADGTKDYYSAVSGSSSTGPTCPTRCP